MFSFLRKEVVRYCDINIIKKFISDTDSKFIN